MKKSAEEERMDMLANSIERLHNIVFQAHDRIDLLETRATKLQNIIDALERGQRILGSPAEGENGA